MVLEEQNLQRLRQRRNRRRFITVFRSQEKEQWTKHALFFFPCDGRGVLKLYGSIPAQRAGRCRAAGCAARILRPEEAALPFDLQSAAEARTV